LRLPPRRLPAMGGAEEPTRGTGEGALRGG
jgi:hypothetical protein